MDEFVELVAELAAASLSRSRARREQLRVEAAEEGGRLREALLSSISHDFRSPLAAIIGSATSLLEYGDKFGEEVRQDLLLNIRDEGERLNEFVANLLNMTRLQAGVLQPSLKCVNVGHVAAAAVARLSRHQTHRPNIIIDAECEVMADPLLLEQAMYNVLDNACKHGASDDGIRVTSRRGASKCEIVISDHGPGLAKEDQAGVFSTFHFARKTGSTKGTGLGLSISQGFIAAMAGRIVARDRSDGRSGLEIVITLPRSQG
jgi:two-component system sensor histidine kinase KdpD